MVNDSANQDVLQVQQTFFGMVPNWVQDHELSDPYIVALYMALWRHADRENRTLFPSIKRLAKIAKMSKSSVIRKLEILEQMGALKRVRRIDSTNLYTIIFDKPQNEPKPKPKTLNNARPSTVEKQTDKNIQQFEPQRRAAIVYQDPIEAMQIEYASYTNDWEEP